MNTAALEVEPLELLEDEIVYVLCWNFVYMWNVHTLKYLVNLISLCQFFK